MTRVIYIARAKKVSLIGNLVLLFLGGGLFVLLALFLGKPHGICEVIFNRLKSHVNPALIGVVGMLPLLPVLVMPIVVPTEQGFAMRFKTTLVPVSLLPERIPALLARAREIVNRTDPGYGQPDCKDCARVEALCGEEAQIGYPVSTPANHQQVG